MAVLTLQMLINSNVSSGSVTATVAAETVGELRSDVGLSSVATGALSVKEEAESKVLLINQDNPPHHQSRSRRDLPTPPSNLIATNLATFFCICVSLAVKYFRSTSYLWMFNEGRRTLPFYLFYQNIISVALFVLQLGPSKCVNLPCLRSAVLSMPFALTA